MAKTSEILKGMTNSNNLVIFVVSTLMHSHPQGNNKELIIINTRNSSHMHEKTSEYLKRD
jgi:hypothetical protein